MNNTSTTTKIQSLIIDSEKILQQHFDKNKEILQQVLKLIDTNKIKNCSVERLTQDFEYILVWEDSLFFPHSTPISSIIVLYRETKQKLTEKQLIQLEI